MRILSKVLKNISPFMKANGFLRSGNSFYYIANDIAYCIALDMPGGSLYVTACVMPLYMPCDCKYYTYGNRLNNHLGYVLPLLKADADREMICDWCNALCQCIQLEVLPFYEQIETPKALARYVEHMSDLNSSFFFCPQVFVERLKMYTYLYLRDYDKTNIAIKRYHDLLISNTFMSSMTQQKFLEECREIQDLVRRNRQDVSTFFRNVLSATQRVLAGSGSTGDKGDGAGVSTGE